MTYFVKWFQRCIQNPVKYLRWSVLRKQFMAKSQQVQTSILKTHHLICLSGIIYFDWFCRVTKKLNNLLRIIVTIVIKRIMIIKSSKWTSHTNHSLLFSRIFPSHPATCICKSYFDMNFSILSIFIQWKFLFSS